MAARFLANFALFIAMVSLIASAADPNRLSDFCVAPKDNSDTVLVNGHSCKNPSEVTVDDFIFRRKNTTAKIFVTPAVLPGLNTLGISVSHSHLVPGEAAPPHVHPHATEVVTLTEGRLTVGFVTYNVSTNTAKLYSDVLSPGDSFVFPQGLSHFMYNAGEVDSRTMSAFSSQNPDWYLLSTVLFNTEPPTSVNFLSSTLKLKPETIKELQSNKYLSDTPNLN